MDFETCQNNKLKQLGVSRHEETSKATGGCTASYGTWAIVDRTWSPRPRSLLRRKRGVRSVRSGKPKDKVSRMDVTVSSAIF